MSLNAPNVPTSPEAEQVGKLASYTIGVILFLFGIARYVLRPLYDESVFNAFVRRSADYERHLREKVFAKDIEAREAMQKTLGTLVEVQRANALDIGRLATENRAITTLLQGIPHLAATVENMTDQIRIFDDRLAETNAIARNNGETIAAHSALLHLIPEDERRKMFRRVEDQTEPAPE